MPHLQGHDDGGLRLRLGAGHEHAARVAAGVVDELCLVVAHDPAGKALVERYAIVQHLVGVRVAGIDGHQLAPLLVDQPDVEGLVVHHLLEQSARLLEHGALVERREKHLTQGQQLVAHAQLLLEGRRCSLQLLVVAGVLESHGSVGGEHLERLDQVEARQPAVGRVVQVEHCRQLAMAVVQGHEERVVLVPLAFRPLADVGCREVGLVGGVHLVLAMVDEVRAAYLEALLEEAQEHLRGHQGLQHAPVDLGVLAYRGVSSEDGGVGLADEHGRLAELKRLGHRRGDGLDHRFEVDAGLELVAEAHEPTQKLDLAALCPSLRRAQVHRRNSLPRDTGLIMSSTPQCTAASAAGVQTLSTTVARTVDACRGQGVRAGDEAAAVRADRRRSLVLYCARGGSCRIRRASSGVAGSRSNSRPRRTTRCTSWALLSASTPFW